MLTVALLTVTGSVALATTAQAAARSCGSSEYVDHIDVTHYPDPDVFTVNVYPTSQARRDTSPGKVTNAIWHAIQACVPGLYNRMADSVYDQLECHQYLASVPSAGGGRYETGDSYGLDSWRPTFASTYRVWIDTGCGNSLGTDPTDASTGTWAPDEGQTDIGANIA